MISGALHDKSEELESYLNEKNRKKLFQQNRFISPFTLRNLYHGMKYKTHPRKNANNTNFKKTCKPYTVCERAVVCPTLPKTIATSAAKIMITMKCVTVFYPLLCHMRRASQGNLTIPRPSKTCCRIQKLSAVRYLCC